MIVTDILRALLVVLIPLLHFAGLLQLWHLYAISFVLTILSLMFDVSIVAIIPQLVPAQLTRANASYQLTNQIAEMAGPLLAGVIIAGIGGFNTLWLDALSFGGTLIVLMLMADLGHSRSAASIGRIFLAISEKGSSGWYARRSICLFFVSGYDR
ncbi:MFS transporter [Paenibacillus rhizoplanae]